MRCLLFHKPYGVLTQFTDTAGRPTMKDFVKVPDVYPAGRLDHDSEGLVLLTDDGPLQHRLSDPRFDHPKTYWVQVERVPKEAAIASLRTGIDIQGFRTKPLKAHLLDTEPTSLAPRDPPVRFRKTVPTAWIELSISEGKNRQIRHMTAAIGHPTLRLVRIAIGPLTLGLLKPGEWRDLTTQESRQLEQDSRRKRS